MWSLNMGEMGTQIPTSILLVMLTGIYRMSEKTKWLVTVIYTEIYPIAVEAETKEEAGRLAIARYEATADLEPAETFYYVEDILKEH